MKPQASAIHPQPRPADTPRPSGMKSRSGNLAGTSSTWVRGAAYGFSAIRFLQLRLAIAPRLRHEHADHPVLARSQKDFAVAAAAQVQIGARKRDAHRALDELLERRVDALARRAADIELDLFDRGH